MRFDLRLHGRTKDGKKCQADVSVYARSQKQLFKQADAASRQAAWMSAAPPFDPIPEGSEITVERVQKL